MVIINKSFITSILIQDGFAMQRRPMGTLSFHTSAPLVPHNRWWALWLKDTLQNSRYKNMWSHNRLFKLNCVEVQLWGLKDWVTKTVLIGSESTADLPRGGDALLWQEARSLQIRLLHGQARDPRSGLCHHLWCSTYFCTAFAKWIHFYNFLFFFYTGEVQQMLEERNVSLSDVEPAPLDTV